MSRFNAISIGILLFIVTFALYLWFAGGFAWNLESTPFAYFNLLAEAFIARRYDLLHPPANPFDLSVYKGAVYLPWGPLPAVLLMPIVKLFGIGASDKIYTAFFGAVNTGIFYVILLELKGLYKKISNIYVLLLTVFFAFGTVHLSAATIARVWFTSQILSLTVFLISLYFFLKFLKTRHTVLFIVSLGFLFLALLGRLWYVMMFPMYAYVVFIHYFSKAQKLLLVLSVLFMSLVFARMYGLYNFRRFGSFFETGYIYQQESERYLSLRHTFGRYDKHYVVHNIWHEFLKPVAVQKSFPFVSPDSEGNGILATSPLFLLLFLLKRAKKQRRLITLFFLGTLPYIVQLMFFFGTGYFQFGARHLLDVIPLLILATALIIPYVKKQLVYALMAISIFINSLGAAWLVLKY